MTRRSLSTLGALGLTILLFEASTLQGQATWGPSTRIGNSAEMFYTDTCPSGKHAIAVEARYGTYVNGLRVQCAQLGPNGEHQSPVWLGLHAGTSGTHTNTFRCPSGKVMVGFQGRSGWWIDRIQIACKTWNAAGGGTQGSVTWTSAAGGTGGQAYGPVLCPGQYGVHKLESWLQYHVIHGYLVYGYRFSCKAAA